MVPPMSHIPRAWNRFKLRTIDKPDYTLTPRTTNSVPRLTSALEAPLSAHARNPVKGHACRTRGDQVCTRVQTRLNVICKLRGTRPRVHSRDSDFDRDSKDERHTHTHTEDTFVMLCTNRSGAFVRPSLRCPLDKKIMPVPSACGTHLWNADRSRTAR